LPLKTVTCSMDFPYLLIGSVEATIYVLSFKNLPALTLPKSPEDYLGSSLHCLSKFVSSRVLSSNNTGVMGTVDGRVVFFSFKEAYTGKPSIAISFVARTQKRTEQDTVMYGQVNAVELGFHNFEGFAVVGGGEEIAVLNTVKRTKVRALASKDSSTGAGTAIRLSPHNQYIAFATGSDWSKGLYGLEDTKKPRIAVVKLSNIDLCEFIAK
jgi:hypothetical protein